MIKITKNEAKIIRNMGMEEMVKHTYTKHKTYYLVEDKKALKALEKYRKETTVVMD